MSVKTKSLVVWILAIPSFIMIPLIYLGGAAIYIWTIIIAFNEYGWIAAIISFFTPILSTLFFVYDTWRHIGFLNSFIIAILIYITIIIVNSIIVSIIQKLEKS